MIALNASYNQKSQAEMVRVVGDYYQDVARGLVEGQTLWNKFGYNSDIDIGTETIWSTGGLLTKLTTPTTLSIVSTSSNDTSGGTGANSIIVYGIDSTRVARTEVVTMNGLTPVVTATTWLGINRMAIYLSGSGATNAGKITATAVSGGSVQGEIPATEGTTQTGFFFVQTGHTALMDWIFININKVIAGTTPVVTIKAFVTSYVSGSKYEVLRVTIDTAVENTIQLLKPIPFVVAERSVIEFQATTDKNDTIVSIRFSLVEIKNT